MEKIYIRRSNVSIVGEEREKTIILYPELRATWVEKHGSDWGAATLNIDSAVTDITLANVTVHNNYGSLFNEHGHQFAIRGGGTRVMILNCSIISDGGDALSLWNRENGMYYHAYSSFEGWVDYVCPRGWCFITDSEFFGHNLSASIWHDGSTDRDQKFVIRNSRFDGVPGFPLGRHHRDGQFFLIDCQFSEAMKDTPIYYPKSPNAVPWIWGQRHYYFNCGRSGGNYSWFTNNLEKAEGSPRPDDVTPLWTFGGQWDPEADAPSVLPFAAFPQPMNGARAVGSDNVILRWTPARDAISHRVSMASDTSLTLLGETSDPLIPLPRLKDGTTYYWRIDEVTKEGVREGKRWMFTVGKK